MDSVPFDREGKVKIPQNLFYLWFNAPASVLVDNQP